MRITIFIVVLIILCCDGVLTKTWCKVPSHVHPYRTHFKSNIRGGSQAFSSQKPVNEKPVNEMRLYIATRIGSKFLDKKIILSLDRSSTIAQVKNEIAKKFSGKPPVELQKLYSGGKLLRDAEIIGDISESIVLPIQLDMMTGYSSYERPMHASELIDAYCASCVQQAYINTLLSEVIISNGTLSAGSTPASGQYTRVLSVLNETIYERMGDYIRRAETADSDAEAPSKEATQSSFKYNPDGAGSIEEWASMKPRDALIARLFDINIARSKKLMLYSLFCTVYAMFGVTTTLGQFAFLSAIPLMWLSKFRSIRFTGKYVRNFLLALLHRFQFLQTFLPTTFQIISRYSPMWQADISSVQIDDVLDNLGRKWRLSRSAERLYDGEDYYDGEE